MQSSGYEAITFEIGDALLKAFEAFPADMLILDIIMQETDYITLCNMLRKKSSVPIKGPAQ